MLDQQVLLHAVDLDLDRAGGGAVADRRCVGERAAGVDAQFFERAQRRSRGTADVVDSTLEAVELFDDRERDHNVGSGEAGNARRVGDQHRSIEHDPRSLTPFKISQTMMGSGDIGQRNSSRGLGDRVEHRNAQVVAEAAEVMVDSRHAGRMARMSEVPCLFCDIAGGVVPARIVSNDNIAFAFLDRSPLFKGHVLIAPHRHAVTLADLDADLVGPFFARVQRLAAVMPKALGCDGTFVAINNVVSQSVAHLHVHIVPRRRKDGLRGFFWPRVKYASDAEADEYAQRITDAL